MPTIGFNNTRNVWTSKYTFETSMYSNINNKLYSYRRNIEPSDDIIYHEHNTGPINTFYGKQQNSVISVSFNQNPSENKIYKSFSIEGTRNLESISSGCVFETSYSLDQPEKKNYTLGPLRYKGGNIYAYMGKDKALKNGYTVNYVGTGNIVYGGNLTDEEPYNTGYFFQSNNLNAGSVVVSSAYTTKFLFSVPSNPSNLFFLSGAGNATGVTSQTDYGDIPSSVTLDTTYDTAITEYGLPLLGQSTWLNEILSQTPTDDPTINLFSVSHPSINGDFLRGQFAEAHISLGKQPFELYSLNLYYEPTPLDHSS